MNPEPHAELGRAHHLWLVTSDIEERIEMAGMAPSVEIPTLMLVSWLANLKRAQFDGSEGGSDV